MATKYYEVIAQRKVKLTGKDIDDIMTTALEGGITAWCRKTQVVGAALDALNSGQISRGGSLMLYDAESSDKWELTREKFLVGLKKYLEEYGTGCVYAGRLDPGDIDEVAADIIIQNALFGELVFG